MVDDSGLFEMSEATFDFSTVDLRRIANFLLEFADQVDSGKWRSSHGHLTQFDPSWVSDHPNADVIAIHPSPNPPMRVVD